ncbi:alpha/beta fold hydrolase [Salsuginibacillus kocurii]|uniref:alpha/beta fold hydrolase n=1 Tax=Salsuginibacillus kocurii TaxID=427078 RepID=UPI000366D72A|nr:alpha/beta hydrolase [Salsuginibacillus kocurii]
MKPIKSWLRFLLYGIAFILLVMMASGLYQMIASSSDLKTYPPAGKVIEINDNEQHVYKNGAGEETVVFTAGSGTASPFADMYQLQEAVAKKHRTIVYERPGYGWSEGTNTERTIEQLTKELAETLEQLNEKGPYLFAAHSMGALEVIHFAQRYPEQVKGIVLLDGVEPAYAARMDEAAPLSMYVLQALRASGVLRLLSQHETVASQLDLHEHLPDRVLEQNRALTLINLWNQEMREEQRMLNENGKAVAEEGAIGDIPLTIISAETSEMEGWHTSQERLLNLSTEAEQITLENTDHFLHHQQPERVVEEILRIAD